MTATTYPATVYDDGAALLRRLGSFWYQLFSDADLLEAYCASTLHVAEQTYLNHVEALNALALDTTPVWHREQWTLLPVYRSQLTAHSAAYGDGVQYGTAGLTYGGSVYRLALPTVLHAAPLIVDRIIDPTVSWYAGTHYNIIAGRMLEFLSDPFDASFATRTVTDADGEDELLLGLWVCQGDYDWKYLWRSWGYALSAYMASSDEYSEVLRSLLDVYGGTPSLAALEAMTAALAGVPLVRHASETIEAIYTRTDRKQVVTDLDVYDIAVTATPAGAVGDTLLGGTPLSDAVTVVEPRVGVYPDIPGIALDMGYVNMPMVGAIIHINESRPLEYVGIDANGYAEVRYGLTGFPGDIEEFWRLAHARGVADGRVLADYLDTRENPVGPPLLAHLPATVNPMRFVLDQLLGQNMVVIVLKPLQFGPDASVAPPFRLLRQAIPPQTSLLTLVALEPANTYIDTGDASEVCTGIVAILDAPEIAGSAVTTLDYTSGPVIILPAADCST